ncbi:MAG: hypothetical protein M5R36_00965 [Deltaproteobacteria bacterium]|nr:hypothetical protein [Deltaproteobacteria bacterium]
MGDLGDGRGFGVRYALRSGPGDDAGAVDPFDFHQREDYVLGGTALGMFEVVRRKSTR